MNELGDTFSKEEKEALEAMQEDVRLNRCHECKVPFIQLDQYTWKGGCEHFPKELRIARLNK